MQNRQVMLINQKPPKWQMAVLKNPKAKKGEGVVLDELGTDTPRLTCSCRKRVDSQEPCEHVAASLLMVLQQSQGGATLTGKMLLHSSRLPYFFPIPEKISKVISFQSPEKQHFYHDEDELVMLGNMDDKPLQVEVWTDFGNRMINKQRVRFESEKGLLFMACNCNQQVLRMCEHETRALGQIMREDDAFFTKWLAVDDEDDTSSEPKEKAIRVGDDKLKRSIFLSELDGFIMFKPVVHYGEKDGDPLHPEQRIWLDEINGEFVERKTEWEGEFVNWLISLHPEFEKQRHGSVFFLSPQAMIANEWFFRFVDQLEEDGVEIFGQKELKSFKYVFSKPETSFSIQSGTDWFDAKVGLAFNGEAVSIETIKKALLNKQDYVVLSDGSLGLLPKEWLKKVEKYLRLGQTQKGELRIPKQHFNVLDELLEDIDDQTLQQEIAERKKALLEFHEIEKTETPSNLLATLRPYQLEGVNWINFLKQYGFGGILADDMGLGKTLQTITVLAQMKQEGEKGTHLVVGPTSLLHNWQSEMEKFCPDLTHYIHHGPDRFPSADRFSEFDVVVTTYGTLVNDVEWLKEFRFSWLVLDESQAIKNLQSQRNKALRLISSENKLAISGTPVENNTFELFAQMQVINPAFLGTAEHFKREYAKPIDQDGDTEKAEELRQLIKPFILRRTKKQVAKDLPEKTETVLYCDMGLEQRAVYEQHKQEVRDTLMGQIEEEGLEKSQFQVLTSLLKLRQLCLSTAIAKLDEPLAEHYSTKIDILREQIRNLPKGSKALVFSQFVKMLGEVKNMLTEEQIPFAYLDGQTRDRQAAVSDFQDDENCKVFVISLKAGGTGLNLTAADYVYILDPWWNPAVEAQAIDRSYRIGQKKQVFAYKMICENSIEEKILKLQQKKLAVAEGVVQSEDGMFKQLTARDLEELLG